MLAAQIAIDDRGPTEARLASHGVRVWAVIGAPQANAGDVTAAAADYDLPPEAMAAALAYYHQHRAAIDPRLALNMVRGLSAHLRSPVLPSRIHH